MTSRSTKGAPPDGLRYASTPGRWVITTTVLGSGVAALDATVVGIALPAVGGDLRVDVAGLQWVVTGYALTLAGLLLVGGALGDRYGRRRIYLLGVVWFAAASLLCGLGCAVSPPTRRRLLVPGPCKAPAGRC